MHTQRSYISDTPWLLLVPHCGIKRMYLKLMNGTLPASVGYPKCSKLFFFHLKFRSIGFATAAAEQGAFFSVMLNTCSSFAASVMSWLQRKTSSCIIGLQFKVRLDCMDCLPSRCGLL